MIRSTFACLALASSAVTAHAHQIWLERDAAGPVRVYVGDAEGAADRGEEVAKLAAHTQVLGGDGKGPAPLIVKPDHLQAAPAAKGDVRLYNDQVWKPWKTDDGKTKAAVFTARAGRSETRGQLDFELVPTAANGNTFTVLFKGQAQPEAAVTVVSPDKWTKALQADASGRVTVPLRGKGRYVLVAGHELADAAGAEIAGQRVDRIGYTTTLSFVVP